MKLYLSKKAILIILIVIISILIINSYLIIDLNNSLRNTTRDSPYDYVIFKDDTTYKAKNQMNGKVEYESNDASFVINQAIVNGNIIRIEDGEYLLTSDILILNKNRLQISSDGAKIYGNGNKIIILGDNYTSSQYNQLLGFEIINSTRVSYSFLLILPDFI